MSTWAGSSRRAARPIVTALARMNTWAASSWIAACRSETRTASLVVPSRECARSAGCRTRCPSPRPGLDEYLGQVHLDSGKIYSHRVGPDRYVAEIKLNGRVYRHRPAALDDYLGRVDGLHSLAEGGAAFFLLLLPIIEEEKIEAND